MPVVFRYQRIRFFFFSNEGNPREPIHIDALRGDAEAKFWLRPAVRVADSVGFNAALWGNWSQWPNGIGP